MMIPAVLLLLFSVCILIYAFHVPDIQERRIILVSAAIGFIGSLWLVVFIWKHRNDKTE